MMRSIVRLLLAGAMFGVLFTGMLALFEWRAPDPLDAVWLGLFFALLAGAYELIDKHVRQLPVAFLAYAAAFAVVIDGGALTRGDELGIVELLAPLGVAAALTALKAFAGPWERWAEGKRQGLKLGPASK
jgi:hypothetical protein